MTDSVSPERRSEIMASIKAKGTRPEWAVRRLVHGMGYRYRLHRRDLPGSPDLVFPSRKKVIFVHGCFWHRHDDEKCKKFRYPSSNKDYWIPKLDRNAERDKENQIRLSELGWRFLVVWECEIESDEFLPDRIAEYLEDA